MIGARFARNRRICTALAALIGALFCQGWPAAAQTPSSARPANGASSTPPASGGPGVSNVPAAGLYGLTGKEQVVDVRVEGVPEKDLHHVVRHIRTHAGRPFDRLTVESDVKRLLNSKRFASADPSYQRVGANGLIVIFRVVERPTIQYLKYRGNTIRTRHLDKKTNLKVGDPLDAFAVDEGRRNLLEYYQEKGFTKAGVFTVEGSKPVDRGVVYLINEGVKQRIGKVEFENNTIASDGRLKTQISSKPPLLYLFKGEYDPGKIEEDVNKLTDYYRSLGFFKARVGREVIFSESQKWVTLRFVIDEGPRYKVTSISFLGHKRFNSEVLAKKLNLKSNDFFDIGKRDHDVSAIQDLYGGDGYVFAVIEPDQRFAEDGSPELSLVYKIEEGDRYAVGDVNVKIVGDNPHTRRNTILNRVSLHPGDVLDTRELRSSERRLKGSNLFANQNPAEEPKITFERPDFGEGGRLAENPDGPGKARGQSPDNVGPAAGRPPLSPKVRGGTAVRGAWPAPAARPHPLPTAASRSSARPSRDYRSSRGAGGGP
ncbi:MAG TPA: POTRA domain-containing protein [Pirellulales bacterium]|nr:POTRA domain-containing protein [Pirellulales bacterium]